MRKQQEKTDRLSLIILAAFLVLSTSHFMCRFDASGYIEGLFEKAWAGQVQSEAQVQPAAAVVLSEISAGKSGAAAGAFRRMLRRRHFAQGLCRHAADGGGAGFVVCQSFVVRRLGEKNAGQLCCVAAGSRVDGRCFAGGAGSFPSFRQHGQNFSDAGQMDDFAGNDADRGLL